MSKSTKRRPSPKIGLPCVRLSKGRKNCQSKIQEVKIPLKVALEKQLYLIGPMTDKSVLSGLIYKDGAWEPYLTRFVLKVVNKGDIFVDIGANLGYYTIIGSVLVGKKGRVISFEPATLNYSYCQRNIKINSLNNVKLFKYALWHKKEIKKIRYSDDFLGGAHLATRKIRISKEQREEMVECISFDELVKKREIRLERLDFIKLDAEGSELQILRGIKKTLSKFRPIMILEINPYCLKKFFGTNILSIWNLLTKLGYKFYILPEQCGRLKLKSYRFNSRIILNKLDSAKQVFSLCKDNELIDAIAIIK